MSAGMAMPVRRTARAWVRAAAVAMLPVLAPPVHAIDAAGGAGAAAARAAGFGELLDTPLVGLSERQGEAGAPSGRYGVGFSAACLCNVPALTIDTATNAVGMVDYCSLADARHGRYAHALPIARIEARDGALGVSTADGTVLRFERVGTQPVYRLRVQGELPGAYVGHEVPAVYTPRPDGFPIEDCGDFDG